MQIRHVTNSKALIGYKNMSIALDWMKAKQRGMGKTGRTEAKLRFYQKTDLRQNYESRFPQIKPMQVF